VTNSTVTLKLPLGIPEIMEYQLNRHPLLYVDAIIDLVPGEFAQGKKSFTYNEWFFPSHFEGDPNVPGFIQIEALVQVFLMTFLTLEGNKGLKTNFLALNNVKFRRKIIPGEVLEIHAVLESFKRGIAKGHASSKVNGDQAVSGEFTIGVPELLEKFRPNARN
jgi:3-hydroxyacyl-[acyl-carrier-protein] dehydratase